MSLLIILNLVFAVIALAVGFVAGAWFSGAGRKGATNGATDRAAEEDERRKLLERERAALATNRLRDLAGGVAGDVGEHSVRVGEITSELQSLDTTDVEATGAGLIDALEKIVAANETLQDKLEKAEEQIVAQAREIHLHESEARTDSLTGLANRRAFDDEMKRRFSEATRKGMPLSLLILDIDFFKKFNDTHGHQAGDEVLRAVGRQLTETCRDMDLPCRYGGEEFAVVMPSTTVDDGKPAGERIRSAVENMVVEFEGKRLRVTTSIGLAQLQANDDIAKVLKRADEALYESKDAGRNCGHWHNGSQCLPFTDRVVKQSEAKGQAPTAPVATPLLDSLPNRTKFADELRRRIAEASRSTQEITILVVELSSYTQLRQKYGPEVGCAALDAVAAVLSHVIRDMDLLARLSDDKFSVMLPNNTVDTAGIVARRTADALEQCPLEFGDDSVNLEVLIGFAQVGTGDTVEELVRRAEDNVDVVADKSPVEPISEDIAVS